MLLYAKLLNPAHSLCYIIIKFPKPIINNLGFPGGSDGKESFCNVGDLVSIPGLGRSPGEGKGYPCHILAWRITGTIQSMGSQRVGPNWAIFTSLLRFLGEWSIIELKWTDPLILIPVSNGSKKQGVLWVTQEKKSQRKNNPSWLKGLEMNSWLPGGWDS